MTTPTPRQVLDLELGDNDANAATVRGYLLKLLHDVWEQGEGFDGKRPFGNSSWENELYLPLVKAGYVAGTLDEDGWLDDFSREAEREANALIHSAIDSLGDDEATDRESDT